MSCKAINCLFFIIALVFAIVVGSMVIMNLPFAQNPSMTHAQKFLMSTTVLFQTMFPILGVAAFIKFLLGCGRKSD